MVNENGPLNTIPTIHNRYYPKQTMQKFKAT